MIFSRRHERLKKNVKKNFRRNKSLFQGDFFFFFPGITTNCKKVKCKVVKWSVGEQLHSHENRTRAIRTNPELSRDGLLGLKPVLNRFKCQWSNACLSGKVLPEMQKKIRSKSRKNSDRNFNLRIGRKNLECIGWRKEWHWPSLRKSGRFRVASC